MDTIASETSAPSIQLIGFKDDFFLLNDPSRLLEGLFPDFNPGSETFLGRFPTS